MADVDWSDVRVGDPDPTPDNPPWCGVESPSGDVCTRRPGHKAPHVSGNGIMQTPGCDFGRSVIAVWPADG